MTAFSAISTCHSISATLIIFRNIEKKLYLLNFHFSSRNIQNFHYYQHAIYKDTIIFGKTLILLKKKEIQIHSLNRYHSRRVSHILWWLDYQRQKLRKEISHYRNVAEKCFLQATLFFCSTFPKLIRTDFQM